MHTKEKGQSLIEVLVGMAAVVLIAAAITVATISSLNNSVYSKNQNLATGYAQQGIEIVRNLRDRKSSSFTQLNGTYCLAKTCDSIDPTANGGTSDPCGPKTTLCDQNVGGENADIFVRQVVVNPLSSYCQENSQNATQGTQVTVNVSWFDAKCGVSNVFCHTVTLSTCLSAYNTISSQ